MPDLSDEQKIEMAKKAAAVMFQSMVGIPQEVQLEAVILLMKALFMSSVRATYRISLYNSVVISCASSCRSISGLEPFSEQS
jgi:hypothetical protein